MDENNQVNVVITPEEEVEQLKAAVQQAQEAHKRALADCKNQERLFAQERINIIKFAASDVIGDLLPSLDHLEMALTHFPDKSLQMIVNQMHRTLEQHGLQKMKSIGQKFDAQKMEAIDQAAGEKDMVVGVSQEGYELSGRILRHAKVIVGNGKDQ